MLPIICTACKEPIPEHELTSLSNDQECISCEMKVRDSADLDNLY